nr:DnaA/Hda family protein [Sneathiella chinensis]
MGIEALTDLIRTPIVLENVDATTDEEKLFHLYNLVKENSGFMILTSRTGPAQWDLGLPDLKSRMGAIQIVRITEPDDSLFAAVLLKLFTDRQLSVSPDVLQYLIARLERSFGEAQRVVAAIDELSLAEKRKITIPLVRNLLGTEKD